MTSSLPPEFDALTPKQRDFVLAYVETNNGTVAARKAGYKGTDDALAVRASEAVRNSKIKAAIDAYMAPKLKKYEITLERTLQELADIGYSDWREFIEIRYGKDGEVIDVKLRLSDKVAALKELRAHAEPQQLKISGSLSLSQILDGVDAEDL